MKALRGFLSLLLAGSALCATATAQQPAVERPDLAAPAPSRPPGGTTLAAAVDAAWQRAVAAREAEGQRQRAGADRAAASGLWAAPPSIEAGMRDDRWLSNGGSREALIAVAWPLWLPGQRSARTAVADASMALADDAVDAARLRLAGAVREAAWALVAQQAENALADAVVQSLAALADDVERRVRSGDLARADALAARAEWLGAIAQQSEARQRLLAAGSRWTLLTGLDVAPSPDEPAPPEAAAGKVPASHPEMRLAAAATEHARRRVALLRASRRDAPELTMGVRQEVAARGESAQYSALIGFRLPLGTADRNQPLQAAALAELDIADTGEHRLRERLDAELAEARAGLQQAQRQLQAERDRAALLRERAQLVDRSFRAGESPLPDLLRALAAATQADAAAARQQAALGLAHARVIQAFGLLP